MNAAKDKVVVIGAGVGGLASAIRLAHQGFDVTVVEAAASPGGKMRTVPSAAGPVDAGPTVFTMRHVFDALFAETGSRLEDWVSLSRSELLARHWWKDGSTLDLFPDRAESRDAISAFAGEGDAKAFMKFCEDAERLFSAFDAPMMQSSELSRTELTLRVLSEPSLIGAMRPWATLAGSLRARFRDPRLRQLFGRYATYVGGSPYASPALLSLVWRAEEMGVWAVQGGMHMLAQAMVLHARALGASFRFGESVAKIEVQSGRVHAVQTSMGERLPARIVVFNGDPAALNAGLLGPATQRAVPRGAMDPRSLSAWVWSFAATPVGPNLHHHNVFFGADPRDEFDPIAKGQMPDDPTLYICAQDRAAGQVPSDLERFEIIMNGAPADTSDEREKETCRMRTFEQLEAFGLRFQGAPGVERLTSPHDFHQLFPASRGSLYGRSPHGMMAAFKRPTARTTLPGLYLAGGGAHPGAGVPMAALSGRHAAAAILMDHASTSRFRRTAMPGGTSMASRTTAAAPSR